MEYAETTVEVIYLRHKRLDAIMFPHGVPKMEPRIR